jgi:hypothetical protein
MVLTETRRMPRNRPRKIAPSRNPPGKRQARRANGVDNPGTLAIIGRWWRMWMKSSSTSRLAGRSVERCY